MKLPLHGDIDRRGDLKREGYRRLPFFKQLRPARPRGGCTPRWMGRVVMSLRGAIISGERQKDDYQARPRPPSDVEGERVVKRDRGGLKPLVSRPKGGRSAMSQDEVKQLRDYLI